MIVMMINWATTMFNFYLVKYLMKYFHGDVYSNFMIGAVADITSGNLTARIIDRFGIKRSFLVGYLVACTGMVGLLVYTGENSSVNAALVFISVFGNGILYTCTYAGN